MPSQSADEIFAEAVGLPAEQRNALLDRACGGDDDLRQRTEALLAADEAAGEQSFLGSGLLGKSIAPPADLPTSPSPNSAQPSDRSDSAAGAAVERFRVLSKYQQGGLGEVLIALDRELNREVAIKQIRPRWRGHEEARQRFLQEAEITGRLEHPGVVPVYAMGTWPDGSDYYAMRFIQGQTLRDVIDEYHALRRSGGERRGTESRPGRAVELRLRQLLGRFVDVCNTVDYAHSRRVLHRDLKPSNIMIGPYGETLVVDWGLAKFLDAPSETSLTVHFLKSSSDDRSGSTPTAIGGAVGTPNYMSPEQARGDIDAIGIATDIYLLGATLYHVLTGRPPNRGGSLAELIDNARHGRIDPPRQLVPEVPKALEAICVKAMAAVTIDRYSSATALASDVECWLADEPVEVYRDAVSVRWARWIRRHRTAAYSAAVAGLFLIVGSIGGSLFYNYQRGRQLSVERQHNAKVLQLQIERQQRLAELNASAGAAEQFADQEIRVGRYSSALSFLRSAVTSLSDEPAVSELRERLDQRRGRLDRIVRFYHAGDDARRENLLSHDTKSIVYCKAALDAIGVWDAYDWWFQLPDQELTAEQRDTLRWDVYQQLILLDGLLTKRMGAALIGNDRSWGLGRYLRGLQNMSTEAGLVEAESVLRVSERIDRFRLAESVNWTRALAQERLGQGKRIRGADLGPPRNAFDAQSLGVLSLIASQDTGFRLLVFKDYQGSDALAAAHELFAQSVQLEPKHYWSRLSLGHTEYLLAARGPAERPADWSPAWRDYEPALKTLGQCIALQPAECFAFADRASVYRYQAAAVARDESLSESERQQRVGELLRRSLADVERAVRIGVDQPWIGWHYGLSLLAVGQTDQAIERFLQASRLTFPLPGGESQDSMLIRVDDLRGRAEVVDVASKLRSAHPNQPEYHTLYATVQLNRDEYADSLTAAKRAASLDGATAHAFAVAGMARLLSRQASRARADFVHSLALDPNHIWSCYGLALCEESAENLARSLSLYERTAALAETDQHASAALLGQARVLVSLGRFADAKLAIVAARRAAPDCELAAIARRLERQLKGANTHRPQVIAELHDLVEYVAEQRHPDVVTVQPLPPTAAARMPLLDGGFELDSGRYWSAPDGAVWATQRGYQGRAVPTRDVAHSGKAALYIRGSQGDHAQGKFGFTGQSFPAEPGANYEVRLWVQADSLAAGALHVETGSGQLVVQIPAGSYRWTSLVGRFHTAATAQPSHPAEIRLNLVSAGPGDAWIDDIEVVRVSAVKRDPSGIASAAEKISTID